MNPKPQNKDRSRSVHYKTHRVRGKRRIADRHSHHRRRQIMQSAVKRHIYDFVIPSSTSQIHNRGKMWGNRGLVAKRKSVIGARDHSDNEAV